MKEDKRPLMVTVQCMTYNQASYIEDAMNGFTMQQTTFPYVCCIIDDASTDGEQEVIKNYLNEHFDLEDKKVVRHEETDDYVLTFARHKTNLNCYFAVLYLKYNHYSIKKSKHTYISEWRDNAKYIAICEGDDYWIDPLKLQKQFDILEQDEGISLCHHNFYELNEITGTTTLKQRIVPERQDLLSVAKNNYTQTLTLFFRNFQPVIPKELEGKTVYSRFWALRLAEIGDLYYIDEPMAVYRRNSNSIYGMRPLSIKYRMTLESLDSSIFWYNICQRKDVVKVLKQNGRKICFVYFCSFVKRFELKNIFRVVKDFFNYI